MIFFLTRTVLKDPNLRNFMSDVYVGLFRVCALTDAVDFTLERLLKCEFAYESVGSSRQRERERGGEQASN